VNSNESHSSTTPRARYEEYQARFKAYTDQELIDAFNREVGNPGWVSARASYLAALHDEFKHRGFDFSAIGGQDSLSFRSKVRLMGQVIEPLDKSKTTGPSIIRTGIENS
jgi:hypothetical protein